jgi:hypothetical protein
MQQALRGRQEPATAIEAAATLIELALNESHKPVEDLSAALARMAQNLACFSGGESAASQPDLARDVAICIESLQFHDRLVQQLTQVRNLLASVAEGSSGDSVDPQHWMVLLENIRARFTSESHRILFNLLLPASGERVATPSLHANEGSVELF